MLLLCLQYASLCVGGERSTETVFVGAQAVCSWPLSFHRGILSRLGDLLYFIICMIFMGSFVKFGGCKAVMFFFVALVTLSLSSVMKTSENCVLGTSALSVSEDFCLPCSDFC